MTMSVEQNENLNILIQESLRKGGAPDAEKLFRDSIEEVQDRDNEGNNMVKQVELILSEQGDIVIEAHTAKLPNLRFNLAKFLLAAVGTTVSVASLLQQPVSLALTVINFLQAVQDLSKIEIKTKDAQMLLAIFSLSREENLVTVDELDTFTGPIEITAAERKAILERLERLGCIIVLMGEIQLNESIIIRSGRKT